MKNIYIAFLFLYFLTACSEEIKPEPLTFPMIFSGKDHKAWSVQYIQFKQQGKGDQTFGLNDCEADDQYIFYGDTEKSYEVSNGPIKCDPSEPDIIVSDSWSFVGAKATLTIIIPFLSNSPLPFFVREVTNKGMTLEIFNNQEKTSSYRINFKAVNQN